MRKEEVEKYLNKKVEEGEVVSPVLPDGTTNYLIDIDGTICKEVGEVIGREPYMDRIEKINKLYDEGHTIVFYTARGLKSGRGEKHYRPITEQQLKEWGVKYHELCFKGHNGDYFIDDRGINAEDFFK